MNRLILLLVSIALLYLPANGQDDTPKDAANATVEIRKWVEQLGHDRYLRRELASQKLVEAGPEAIPHLIQKIRTGDLEAVERATAVVTQIALACEPIKDGGAWDSLSQIASKGAGRSASCALIATQDIRKQRAAQAPEALAIAGIFVGLDKPLLGSISLPPRIIRIDDEWQGDPDSLQWLDWLDGIQYARIKGSAVNREVLEHVAKIPGIKSLLIVDGKIDGDTLTPLKNMKRIDSLEFRYVTLSDADTDLIASMPIRMSLNLKGTGVSTKTVEAMRVALPGLQIAHSQGGFLGVSCAADNGVCRINTIVPDSAAQEAGLQADDIIIQVEDSGVKQFKDLQDAINEHVPGDEVIVKFLRDGKTKTVKLRLRRLDEDVL